MTTPEERIKDLGIEIGDANDPSDRRQLHVPAVRAGNLLFLSGHVPAAGTFVGKVGRDLTVEQGYQAARSVGTSLIATIKANLGRSQPGLKNRQGFGHGQFGRGIYAAIAGDQRLLRPADGCFRRRRPARAFVGGNGRTAGRRLGRDRADSRGSVVTSRNHGRRQVGLGSVGYPTLGGFASRPYCEAGIRWGTSRLAHG